MPFKTKTSQKPNFQNKKQQLLPYLLLILPKKGFKKVGKKKTNPKRKPKTMFKYTYIHAFFMSTKTISITEDAYERLNHRKKERESFSDVIKRITGKKSLADFAGILSEKEASELETGIAKSRKASRARMNNFGA